MSFRPASMFGIRINRRIRDVIRDRMPWQEAGGEAWCMSDGLLPAAAAAPRALPDAQTSRGLASGQHHQPTTATP